MNKIYCKNCKWTSPLYCYPPIANQEDYYGDTFGDWILKIFAPHMLKYKPQYREILNKYGDCPYYKLKSWKFWLRR